METTNLVDAPVHYNPNQLVTYKVIDLDSPDQVAQYPTEKVTQIEWALERARRADKQLNSLRLSVANLEEMLAGWIEEDTSTEEIVSDICGLFGFNPTKTVEFTATVRVHGAIEVPITEIGDFDLESYAMDALSVDSHDGNIEISSWDVEQIDEC